MLFDKDKIYSIIALFTIKYRRGEEMVNGLKLGYMAGFRGGLVKEIEFAKEHFDFIEITLLPDVFLEIDGLFPDLKRATEGVEIVGHLHWDIIDFDDIIKNINILKSLGARKVTIHPFENEDIYKNVILLDRIAGYCRAKKQRPLLMIENVSSGIYSQCNTISTLLTMVPGTGFTLDIGHANLNDNLELFASELGDRITHIHLHDSIGERDHLFYSSKRELNKALNQIRLWGYQGTVLLETFAATPSEKKTFRRDFKGMKQLHLNQLSMIKK